MVLLFSAEASDEPSENFCCFVGLLRYVARDFRRHVAETGGNCDLVRYLSRGCKRNVEKADVIRLRRPGTAFHDIGRDRDRGSTQLRGQAVSLILWKR